VDLGHVLELNLEHLTDSTSGRTFPRRRQVADLEHDHVTAVAAAPIKEATGGRITPYRRDDLEERVAERKHGVPKAEILDTGIRERFTEAQLAAQASDHRLEPSGNKDRLAHPRKLRIDLRHADGV
jgi:hypothetical protein